MARDHVAYLISKSYEADALNQLIPVDHKREVFCTIKSLQQSEWFAAGNAGQIWRTDCSPDWRRTPAG